MVFWILFKIGKIQNERKMVLKYYYDPQPTICPYCSGKVVYGKMQEFGIAPYQSGYCYICTECNAFVGTHNNRPKEALGKIAYGKTRSLRVQCHEEFEKHYSGSSHGKDRLYYLLSQKLGLSKEECHFGYMDDEQLIQALRIMTTEMKNLYIR